MNYRHICRVCSVEHKLPRNKKGGPIVGKCPICGEPHALYWTSERERVRELSEAQGGRQ